MKIRRLVTAAILALAAGSLHAQEEPAPAAPETEQAPAWEFGASVYGYFPPEDTDYGQPTVTADREALHLEARYNYEGHETGSAWFGYNFSGGETVTWELTPMVGGVFGDTAGVAPGYKGSLSWKKLEFYSEGEYVFDTGGSSDSFLYNWTELTLAPVEWFRFGLITQRTRVYKTDRDIQRGVLAGVSFRHLTVTAYAMNPDEQKPNFIFAVGVTF